MSMRKIVEKNIDKFKNCVIKWNFNNIFITYTLSKEMIDEGMNGSSVFSKARFHPAIYTLSLFGEECLTSYLSVLSEGFRGV